MPDSTTFSEMVTRTQRETKSRRSGSPAAGAGRVALWAAVLAVGVMALVPIVQQASRQLETWALLDADDATIARAMEQDWPRSAAPDFLEMLAERGVQLATPDMGSAYVAAQRAVALDPSRAFAWAQLAWLESQRAGQANKASLEALTRSMDACPLCDESLIRWRFNFVLANWRAMPEAMRRRAFEHADILRWNGPNTDFLAEMRVKANQNGIAFDAYRAAVNTPVRSWDIGPAPQARAKTNPPA